MMRWQSWAGRVGRPEFGESTLNLAAFFEGYKKTLLARCLEFTSLPSFNRYFLAFALIHRHLCIDISQPRMSVSKSRYLLTFAWISRKTDALNLSRIIARNYTLLVEGRVRELVKPPLVAYWYNKTLSRLLCNYGTVAANTKHTTPPSSIPCVCQTPQFAPFTDPHHGHIATTDRAIIRNQRLNLLFQKGLGFRIDGVLAASEEFPKRVGEQLSQFAHESCEAYGLARDYFIPFIDKCVADIEKQLGDISHSHKGPLQLGEDAIDELKSLQQSFVITSTDKCANLPAIICKRFYVEQLRKILGNTDAYVVIFWGGSDPP